MNNRSSTSEDAREHQLLPFVIEFIKFSTGFVAIVATALFALHLTTAVT